MAVSPYKGHMRHYHPDDRRSNQILARKLVPIIKTLMCINRGREIGQDYGILLGPVGPPYIRIYILTLLGLPGKRFTVPQPAFQTVPSLTLIPCTDDACSKSRTEMKPPPKVCWIALEGWYQISG